MSFISMPQSSSSSVVYGMAWKKIKFILKSFKWNRKSNKKFTFLAWHTNFVTCIYYHKYNNFELEIRHSSKKMWAKWNWNYLFIFFCFFFAFLDVCCCCCCFVVVWLLFSITIIYLIRVFLLYYSRCCRHRTPESMWKLRRNKIWNAIILPPPHHTGRKWWGSKLYAAVEVGCCIFKFFVCFHGYGRPSGSYVGNENGIRDLGEEWILRLFKGNTTDQKWLSFTFKTILEENKRKVGLYVMTRRTKNFLKRFSHEISG